MAKKPYTVEKEINGVKYTAQFNGISAAVKALDEWRKENENISISAMSEYILAHVIVEPKGLTMDDFDSMEELNEVVGFGREVLQGNFRKETVENTTEKKG